MFTENTEIKKYIDNALFINFSYLYKLTVDALLFLIFSFLYY